MTTPIPAGWKLVPEAMTLDMCVAFAEAWFSKVRCIDDHEMQDAYAAMLAAAPEAPPITVALDPDPRGVSIGVWQGSSCIYTGAHAIPSSAPDAPLASMARAIFGDQIGSQMDAMAGAPSLSSLRGFAPGACEGMKSEDYVNKVRNDDWSSPECTPAPSAPGDAQDERPYCYALETRGRWGDESDVLLDVEYNATDSFSGGRTGGIPLYRRPAPAAGDARVWQGLTKAELASYVGSIIDYGTDFVAPLYSVVESVEKRLREKNAASQQQEG